MSFLLGTERAISAVDDSPVCATSCVGFTPFLCNRMTCLRRSCSTTRLWVLASSFSSATGTDALLKVHLFIVPRQ